MKRIRHIVNIGGTHYIYLSPTDLKDYGLKKGDNVDISEIQKTRKKKEVVQ